MMRRPHRRREGLGLQMTPNAESAADDTQMHEPHIQTRTSASELSMENTDADGLSIQTAGNAPNGAHCCCGNRSNLQLPGAISSNLLDCHNGHAEFAVADTTAGRRDGTQENRVEACSASASDSPTGGKGEMENSREEAGSTTEGHWHDKREEGPSKDAFASTAKGGTHTHRHNACFKHAMFPTTGGRSDMQDNTQRASKCDIDSITGGKSGTAVGLDQACYKSATISAAESKARMTYNTKKTCPKCVADSTAGGKCKTQNNTGEASSKCVTTSTTGLQRCDTAQQWRGMFHKCRSIQLQEPKAGR
ncbi:hypothetical protein HPB51_023776 [Rhipicephalus microplus]|uniref:Uncharacterized protein n=1 Tax=Rhipicephalus microplus TaxID=6941 RepID=A0A9J6E3W0_RHIMP|nr:hypothetical protein HPB51_023776 [Rhipicephalus microplus]